MVIDYMKDCLFCKILKGDIPSKKVYEDNFVSVIMDVNPCSNGHMLIIPNKHFTDFTEIDNETLIHINDISKKMKNLIYDKLNANGIKIVVNYGSNQEIKHYHMHLIPSYEKKQSINIDDTYNKLL